MFICVEFQVEAQQFNVFFIGSIGLLMLVNGHILSFSTADTFLDQTVDVSFIQKSNRIKFGASIRQFWHNRQLRERMLECCLFTNKPFNDHQVNRQIGSQVTIHFENADIYVKL